MLKPEILLVNDDPASLLAMESLLTGESIRLEYSVEVARSGEEALRKVLTHEFAVILLDVNMPIMDGFETAEAIHSHPRSALVPIIFITAHFDNEISRLKGYQKGAVDYLFTPVIPQILFTKIAVFVDLRKKNLELQKKTTELARLNRDLRVQTMQDLKKINAQLEEEIIERKQAEDRARELAIRDPLTGLLNRRSLIDHLNHAISLSGRHKKKFALLFLDLDKFKTVNDTQGHETGDALLLEVSKRISTAIRDSDTAARLGGDEFIILLEVVSSIEDISNVAEKVSRSLSREYHLGDRCISTSATIGIATFPKDGKDVQTLMKNADLAMYNAKHQQRGSIQFFNEGLNLEQIENSNAHEKFERAVKKQEFVIHYQPKMNIKSGAVTGIEAFLRWRHPRLGLSCPSKIISPATDKILLASLNENMISVVCMQIRTWLDSGSLPDGIPVIINLTCTHLPHNICDIMSAALKKNRLSQGNIQLHVAETLLFSETEGTNALLTTLASSGIILGIVNFGIGYTSLSALKNFSFRFLKIDSSLVQDLEEPSGARLLSGIIKLAHAMSLKVVVDGVENKRQLEVLRKLGCDDCQGSLIAEPGPAGNMRETLEFVLAGHSTYTANQK